MSNRVISSTGIYTGYGAAVSIDASNDYLLIQQSGVYNKINRNVFLGISSAPLGTTDSQSPTNKTFDNSNIFTIRDDRLTLQDNGDVTRQATFQLSSITAGQTRTITIPDASLTMVGTATTQTLTNKTITSPTMTGGTIDNSTITVDSIAGHTSPTIVTVANLQISNGVLNSANAVTATSVADGAIQPKALVTGTGSGWAWQSYTPTWTNVSVGNGTQASKYMQIGKTVFVRVSLIFGTTTTTSSDITFTLPVTSVSYPGTSSVPVLGDIRCYDSSAVLVYIGHVTWASTTTAISRFELASGTYVTQQVNTGTAPATWATGDEFSFNFFYEAA